MTPMKLNVAICRFPYGGNGGTSSEVPEIGDWLVETVIQMKNDPRVGEIIPWRKSDTPIDMVRNDAVYSVREAGADVIIMIDSDMAPDVERKHGDVLAKNFWKSSFDFLYQRKLQGLLTVIGAPYGGPSPVNNCYVFRWANWRNNSPDQDWRIEAFAREEAATRGGFEEVAALPTGLIMFDAAIFDHIEPPYFYYEYDNDGQKCAHCGQRKPGPRRQKASTEDVTATRDISLNIFKDFGYNPVFCNWDSWAGHWKPELVRKPRPVTLDHINQKYVEAVKKGRSFDQQFLPNFKAANRPPVANGNAGLKSEEQREELLKMMRLENIEPLIKLPDTDTETKYVVGVDPASNWNAGLKDIKQVICRIPEGQREELLKVAWENSEPLIELPDTEIKYVG